METAPAAASLYFRVIIAAYRALGAAVGIAVMEALARYADGPLARVPFVTSIVLVLALPDAEPSRARSVIGGHVVSAIAGYIALMMLGAGPTPAAVAVGLATFAMLLMRCMHPPAGINALLFPTMALTPRWIFSPVLIGTLLLVAFATSWRAGEKFIARRFAHS